MNEAVARMFARYDCRRLEDYVRALREILQEIALLGLWRSKFFEKAAFYGGTALRILCGMDRYSEDLDFSLLKPMPDFDMLRYSDALQKEIRSFGFDDLILKAGSSFSRSRFRSEHLRFRTCSPVRCMPFFAGNGRAGSRDATGMTWSGMPRTILNSAFPTSHRGCSKAGI